MSRKSHTDAGRTSSPVQRRTVVRGAGAVLGGGLVAAAGVPASGAGDAASTRSNATQAEATNGFVQSQDCVTLPPVDGEVPVEEFFKYDSANTRYSSVGPVTGLQRERTSRLFVYRGPDGSRSLVVAHGKHHLEDVPEGGGSASFAFEGLPSDGEWLVRDDSYDGPDLFDEWERDGDGTTVHWTWQGGRTDGGVYTGLGEEFSITVEPAFNEDAELYGEHYSGDVEAWEALGGSLTNPNVVSLAMDEQVVIESNGC